MSAPQASLPLGGAKTLPTTQLIHGDCLEVMPTLPSGSVQMVFADLPYRMPKFYSTECRWDVSFSLETLWCKLKEVSTCIAPCVFTAAQPFTTKLISSNLGWFRYCLVWDKVANGNHVRAKYQPMRNHEDIVIFYEKQPTYNSQMIPRDRIRIKSEAKIVKSQSGGVRTQVSNYKATYTHRYPRSIIVASSRADPARGLHPTQKPVALLEWLIRTYTNEGDTVLDPTAGSGTTAIAALRTGRHSICIEKDPDYYKIMCKRVADERARLESEG